MDHNLREVLMPLIVLGSLGGGIVIFTRAITDYMLKKKMIEKGFVNEDTQSIFKKQAMEDNKFASLKWGLIIFFAGLSLIIMEFIGYDSRSPLPYGLLAVSVSFGFLLYYFLTKKDK